MKPLPEPHAMVFLDGAEHTRRAAQKFSLEHRASPKHDDLISYWRISRKLRRYGISSMMTRATSASVADENGDSLNVLFMFSLFSLFK